MLIRLLPACLCLCFSSRNQKKENISSKKGGVFRDFIRIFALSFDTISTKTIQNLNKLLNYEHIEKAIWWAKNY